MKLFVFIRKSYLIFKFILVLFWDTILANLRVAHEVMTPRLRAKPGVVAIPLASNNAIVITLFACVITLTPGTLTLDISSDRKSLYLHAMFIDDVDQLKKELKRRYEKPLMEILQ